MKKQYALFAVVLALSTLAFSSSAFAGPVEKAILVEGNVVKEAIPKVEKDKVVERLKNAEKAVDSSLKSMGLQDSFKGLPEKADLFLLEIKRSIDLLGKINIPPPLPAGLLSQKTTIPVTISPPVDKTDLHYQCKQNLGLAYLGTYQANEKVAKLEGEVKSLQARLVVLSNENQSQKEHMFAQEAIRRAVEAIIEVGKPRELE